MVSPLPKRRRLTLLTGWLLIGGCYPRAAPEPTGTKEGYVPVYTSLAQMRNVQVVAAKSLRNPGKIYVKDQYLFIVEPNQGVHVVDNHDPAAPVPLAFISIPGTYDVAVKDSTLYANNATDLVALSIANPAQIRLVSRVEKAFTVALYPPVLNTWFECADPAKGVVSSWVRATLTNPRCYR